MGRGTSVVSSIIHGQILEKALWLFQVVPWLNMRHSDRERGIRPSVKQAGSIRKSPETPWLIDPAHGKHVEDKPIELGPASLLLCGCAKFRCKLSHQ